MKPTHCFNWNTQNFDILYVVSDNVPAMGLPLSRGASIFYMAPEMGTAINIFPNLQLLNYMYHGIHNSWKFGEKHENGWF